MSSSEFTPPPVDWKAHVAKLQESIGDDTEFVIPEFLYGEAFIGDTNEMAHPTVLIGHVQGAVGMALANAFANPQRGHTPMLAVRSPNLATPIATLVVNEVTIGNLDQAVLVGGPLQRAAADAVTHCAKAGFFGEESNFNDLAIIFQGFIHPSAKDVHKIYAWNYWAMVECIVRALTYEPSLDAAANDEVPHPYCSCETAKFPEDLEPLTYETPSKTSEQQ